MTKFLNKKISNYFKTSITPKRCIKYLKKTYPTKINNYDHMAFRTINQESFFQMHNIITSSNFEKIETLEIPINFKSQDVWKYANWYKNSSFIIPRIFLSRGYGTISHDSVINSKFLSNSKKYKKLRKLGDDYVAWTWLYNDEINHVAIDMSDYEDFEDVILKMASDLDLNMNYGNDKMFQVSKDEKLIQCSTKADLYNGKNKNYIEFVKRIDGREGFEGGNAHGIFQSTK